jgi:acetyl-CoA C-acetyltransferase
MKIGILGTHCTQFGELWDKSLEDLLAEAQLGSLNDAKIEASEIDEIFVSNMCASMTVGQQNLGALSSEILNLHIPGTTIEGACASGGLALRMGALSILSGLSKIVMVVGAEKMTDTSPSLATTSLVQAASEESEQLHGATFPGLMAMVTRAYVKEYNIAPEELASVGVKNHLHGYENKHAHIRKKISIEQVLSSPVIADPLRLLHCSPVSDGAAAIILCSEDVARAHKKSVFLAGFGQGSDTLRIQKRKSLTEFRSTQVATQAALSLANISIKNVDFLEVHDAFSAIELISLEDLGIFPRGTAGKETLLGKTKIDGSIPVNPSGGLKSKGHPVGATGISQAVEVVRQLEQKSDHNQLENIRIGMCHNLGGSGSTATVHIFTKE